MACVWTRYQAPLGGWNRTFGRDFGPLWVILIEKGKELEEGLGGDIKDRRERKNKYRKQEKKIDAHLEPWRLLDGPGWLIQTS